MIIHTHNSIHPYQETIATNKSKSRLRDFLDSKMSQNAEIATPFEALGLGGVNVDTNTILLAHSTLVAKAQVSLQSGALSQERFSALSSSLASALQSALQEASARGGGHYLGDLWGH